MKNRLFCLLLLTLFALGNFAFTTSLSGVFTAEILIGKTGTVVCSFTVPDEYLDKKGELTLPIEITINNSKQPVYTASSNDLKTPLPSSLSGTFYMEARVGNYSFAQEINL